MPPKKPNKVPGETKLILKNKTDVKKCSAKACSI